MKLLSPLPSLEYKKSTQRLTFPFYPFKDIILKFSVTKNMDFPPSAEGHIIFSHLNLFLGQPQGLIGMALSHQL